MQYLGRIAGSGLLMRDGDAVARTSYDFEGFARQRGVVVSSGEINLAPSDLKTVFGRLNVQLLTDDGRLLDLRFTDKELRHASDVAQVEVSGDLPGSSAEWRGEAPAAATCDTPAPRPAAASIPSKTPASQARRRRDASA
jgi:hypothetical protein